MSKIIPEDYLVYLEYCYENWENIEIYDFDSFHDMGFTFHLVIRTPDGKYYSAYVDSSDEGPTEDFSDIEWTEVVPHEVTVIQWTPV